MQKVTQKELKEVFDYNPKTGVLSWNVAHRKGISIGDRAGILDKKNGYRHVGVFGKSYSEHRLIWCMVYGYFPENQIDHINGVRDDNRISNLREVSRRCNSQNKGINIANTSGFPGVGFRKTNGMYQAYIGIDGVLYRLGDYDTPLEAALARYTAEVCDPRWICNHRTDLIRAIRRVWPEFNPVHQEKHTSANSKDIIALGNLAKSAAKIRNARRRTKGKLKVWATAVRYKAETKTGVMGGVLLLPGKLPMSDNKTVDKVIAEIEKNTGKKVIQLLEREAVSKLIK